MGISLREYLFKHDISVNKFAKACGVSAPYMSAIKCYTKPASPKLAKKMEEESGGEISWLEVLMAYEASPKRKKRKKETIVNNE